MQNKTKNVGIIELNIFITFIESILASTIFTDLEDDSYHGQTCIYLIDYQSRVN